MTDIATDVVIVFYGEQHELKTYADSVERHCKSYKLHLIDNNPTNRGLS